MSSAQGAGEMLGQSAERPPVKQGIWEAEVQLSALFHTAGGVLGR